MFDPVALKRVADFPEIRRLQPAHVGAEDGGREISTVPGSRYRENGLRFDVHGCIAAINRADPMMFMTRVRL
jgi:hypothetical protein